MVLEVVSSITLNCVFLLLLPIKYILTSLNNCEKLLKRLQIRSWLSL